MIKPAFVALSFAAASAAFAQSPGKPSPAAYDMHQMFLNGAHESLGMKPSADIDRDFALMMRHQHKISIRLAEHEAQHGKDEAARTLARRIAEAHKKEAEALDAWLKAHQAKK